VQAFARRISQEGFVNIEFIFIAIIVIGIAIFLLRHTAKTLKFKQKAKLEGKKAAPAPTIQIVKPEIKPEPVSPPIPLSVPPVTVVSFTDRLKKGLSRSRQEVWGKLSTLFSGGLDEDKIESLEELLYGADIGTATVAELMVEVHKKAKEGNLSEESFKNFLFDFLKAKMEPIQSKVDHALYQFNPTMKGPTKVIMVVGVNGAGKTTTIGKLATKLRSQGASVVVGACDTFRAAAVDQLQVWCDRAGATMIRAKEGSNPSGVGYDSLQAAINQNADYCILDTAGRLHTKENLMDELVKSKNVLKKLDPSAPHQILLVIDAITGQNALRQAEEFHKALDLTGLIFTKCDGSSKAGSAVSIVEQLKIPIAYIGVGETAEDLDVFRIDDYLKALLGL
jgi:fused signal recognition particle receptor